MRLEDCFKSRALRKGQIERERSSKSKEMAYKRLNKATELQEKGFYEECVVASYSAMLMAARALLFHDGIIEKNHYCVVLYLNKYYLNEIGPELISWLDTYRSERHQWFYGIEGLIIEPDESSDALDRANRFLERISSILGDREEE